MPMKVHDTHGLNIVGAIQKNDSSQITLLSLRFSFSLPYTKTSTYIYINMSGPLFHNLNVLQMHFNPLFPYHCLKHINSFS